MMRNVDIEWGKLKFGHLQRNKDSLISLWYVVWWRDGTTNPEKMHYMKVINDFF